MEERFSIKLGISLNKEQARELYCILNAGTNEVEVDHTRDFIWDLLHQLSEFIEWA